MEKISLRRGMLFLFSSLSIIFFTACQWGESTFHVNPMAVYQWQEESWVLVDDFAQIDRKDWYDSLPEAVFYPLRKPIHLKARDHKINAIVLRPSLNELNGFLSWYGVISHYQEIIYYSTRGEVLEIRVEILSDGEPYNFKMIQKE